MDTFSSTLILALTVGIVIIVNLWRIGDRLVEIRNELYRQGAQKDGHTRPLGPKENVGQM